MNSLLFSGPDFDTKWAYASVSPYLKKDGSVLILPFLYSDEWSEDDREWEFRYRKESREYERIMTPFRNHQIKDEQITWLNPNTTDHETAVRRIAQADIIYMCGDHPDAMMRTITTLDLQRTFLEFEGTMITDACASFIIMDRFDSAYEWEDQMCNGIGLYRGFAVEPGYVEDVRHLERLIRDIEMHGKAVFGFGKDGGLIISNGHYEMLGNAFTCSAYDLENIYQALADARSRLEYYGGNGLWEE
ncbi:MAG: hypothetical protein ACI32N_02685 [Bulleidia sp.]